MKQNKQEVPQAYIDFLKRNMQKQGELAAQIGYLKGIIWSMVAALDDKGIDPADLYNKELLAAIKKETDWTHI